MITGEQHQSKRTGEATSTVAGVRTIRSKKSTKAMAGAIHMKRIEEARV
jgi:hypothetical protein